MREELAHGSFAANGQNLNFQKSMNAEAGSFALTGFTANRKISEAMDHGSFALTGQAINFKKTANLEVGSFAVTGQDLTTRFEGSVALDQGSIALTGQAANFRSRRILFADAGSFLSYRARCRLGLAFKSSFRCRFFSLTGFDANA